MENTIYFVVTGEERIHCSGCESRIAYALRRLPGVQDVRASAENQRVLVSVDPLRIGAEQIQAKLEQLGYRVRLAGGAA